MKPCTSATGRFTIPQKNERKLGLANPLITAGTPQLVVIIRKPGRLSPYSRITMLSDPGTTSSVPSLYSFGLMLFGFRNGGAPALVSSRLYQTVLSNAVIAPGAGYGPL